MTLEYLKIFKRVFLQEIEGVHLAQIEMIVMTAAVLVLVPGLLVAGKNKKISLYNVILFYLNIVYMGIVLLITIFRREFGSKPHSVYLRLHWGSLRKTIWEVNAAFYSLLNIMLFVPFGVLVSLLFSLGVRKKRRWISVISTTMLSMIFSISIEFTQLATQTGIFEVTDIFNNTLGGLMGAVIGVIVASILDSMKSKDREW